MGTLVKVLGGMVYSLVSEKVVKALIILLISKLVKKTETTLDDDAWKIVKEALEK